MCCDVNTERGETRDVKVRGDLRTHIQFLGCVHGDRCDIVECASQTNVGECSRRGEPSLHHC